MQPVLLYTFFMKPVCIETAPYEVNTWVLTLSEGRAVIIDPSGNARAIAAHIARLGLTPCAILLTHGHYEQMAAIPGLLKKYPGLPVGIHKDDEGYLGKDAATFHLSTREKDRELRALAADKQSWLHNLPEPAFFLEEGPAPEVPGVGPVLEGWEVIHTPGHTAGSICLYNMEEKLVFTGDLKNNDLTSYRANKDSEASKRAMEDVMRSFLTILKLPPDTVMLPSIGAKETVGNVQARITRGVVEEIKKMKQKQKR